MSTNNSTSSVEFTADTFHGKGGDAHVAVVLYCEPTRSYYKLEWNGFGLLTTNGTAKGLAVALDEFDKVMSRSLA